MTTVVLLTYKSQLTYIIPSYHPSINREGTNHTKE